MQVLTRRWMAVLAAVVLAAGLAHVRADVSLAAPESVGFSGEGLAALRQQMRGLVDKGRLAGVATLVARHGQVVHFDAYGLRDLDSRAPVERDTIFRIASMTKPIVGVAMMMLWEEGKWALDDPVSKHIPEFAGLKVATGGDEVAPSSPMTMRQLMSHTAGFDASGGYTDHALRAGNLQDMIHKLARLPLAFHPGTEWRYGPSVDIQGYLVEKLSGQTLDVFLRERIFEPLGMRDTGFWVDRSKAGRASKLFTYDDGGRIITAPTQVRGDLTEKPAFLSGGGGLNSTAEDYFRFCQMLLDGGEAGGRRLLKASTVELMYANVLEPGVTIGRTPGLGFGMDFAIVLDPAAAETAEGRNTYYWSGAYGTWFWIDPTNDLIVVGMIQNTGGSRAGAGTPPMRTLSRDLIYDALVDPGK
jgi:CubicO group peptidase (beta-lactamase class C family)